MGMMTSVAMVAGAFVAQAVAGTRCSQAGAGDGAADVGGRPPARP
ncbi:hypothetical protein [Sphaerisporangium perillae]|nr:hypothetical protein [Sphaerisporangium perillae]